MNRRSFISLSTLSAASTPMLCHAEEENRPEDQWFENINRDVMKFKATSEEGDLVLNVELVRPEEDEVAEVKDENGDLKCYRYKGKDQPNRFYPGCTLLTRFELFWDGKQIPIQERFWSDLAGLRIETSPLDPEKLKPELRWKAIEFLDSLDKPRLSLSADNGTVLIEWKRGEECDSSSTIRWIISKSGTVLRHRYSPPHEC